MRRRRQAGMGYGLVGLQATAPIRQGTDVAVYGGTVIHGDVALAAYSLRHPSTQVLMVHGRRGGGNRVYIDGRGDLTLGGMANHACGTTYRCPANVGVVIDDEDRNKVMLVSLRDIEVGEWILLDYGIDYVPETDGDNRELDWLRDYVCPVCSNIDWPNFDVDAMEEEMIAAYPPHERVVHRLEPVVAVRMDLDSDDDVNET